MVHPQTRQPTWPTSSSGSWNLWGATIWITSSTSPTWMLPCLASLTMGICSSGTLVPWVSSTSRKVLSMGLAQQLSKWKSKWQELEGVPRDSTIRPFIERAAQVQVKCPSPPLAFMLPTLFPKGNWPWSCPWGAFCIMAWPQGQCCCPIQSLWPVDLSCPSSHTHTDLGSISLSVPFSSDAFRLYLEIIWLINLYIIFDSQSNLLFKVFHIYK